MSSSSATSETKAEEMPSIGSNVLDNSIFQSTMEKLDGKNYREWAQSIQLVVDGKRKLGYLTRESKKPTSNDAAPAKMEVRKLNGDCVARQLK